MNSQKLGSHDFWQTANSAPNKSKSDIPALLYGSRVLTSASDKGNYLADTWWVIYLYGTGNGRVCKTELIEYLRMKNKIWQY